jgi:hypothetical protein
MSKHTLWRTIGAAVLYSDTEARGESPRPDSQPDGAADGQRHRPADRRGRGRSHASRSADQSGTGLSDGVSSSQFARPKRLRT